MLVVIVVVVVVVVVVAMLGHLTGSHMGTEKRSTFQNFYFNALKFMNVIFFANFSLLDMCSRSKPVSWLRLPPAVSEKYLHPFIVEQMNQLSFVGSYVISHNFAREKYNS